MGEIGVYFKTGDLKKNPRLILSEKISTEMEIINNAIKEHSITDPFASGLRNMCTQDTNIENSEDFKGTIPIKSGVVIGKMVMMGDVMRSYNRSAFEQGLPIPYPSIPSEVFSKSKI